MPRRGTGSGAGRAQGLGRDVVLRDEPWTRLRRQPGRPRRSGRDLPPARHCRRTRSSVVARVSQRTTVSRCTCDPRARPDRSRAVDQRARNPDRGSVDELHGEDVNLTRDTALTEEGKYVAPTRHDILTGSNADGTLMTGGDATCGGWTSHSEGRAMVGHHNRYGGGRGDSWNSAHLSRGCSQAALRASLGDGLLYCFAAD